MQIRLYLDEDAMDSDLVHTLRMHRVNVTTALDEGLIEHYDKDHLAFAAPQSCAATLQRRRADAPPAQDHSSQISRSHARAS